MDLLNPIIYVIIILVSYVITQTLLHKLRNLPPIPFRTLPILGHLYLLNTKLPIHKTLATLSDRYGPAVLLYLGSRCTLIVSSASTAEDCLHHNDVTFASRPRLIGTKFLGYDSTVMLWAPYGPLWRTHRRIASTEVLSTHRLNLLSHIRADEVSLLVRGIYKGGEDRIVDVKVASVELMNNIMMRTIAGKRIHGEAQESDLSTRFKTILNELMNSGGAFTIADFIPLLKFVGIHKLAERKWKAIFVKLDKFLQDLVEEQRMKLVEEEFNGGDESGKHKNLIQVLIELKKTDPDYATDKIIKGLVEIMLLAGTETSASTIEWALALLINNPDAHNKAKNEIEERVGYERLMEESDVTNLPYLHCIINETLRMYPAAPITPPHESTDDSVVAGYHIPKGTMLHVNIWAIQNDPKVWDEPWKFKPERFEGVTGDRIGYKFMPFGSGRRSCPGENLAMRSLGLTLGSLIQCFDFEGVGEMDMEESVSVSMRKVKALQVMFKPRKQMLHILSHI